MLQELADPIFLVLMIQIVNRRGLDFTPLEIFFQAYALESLLNVEADAALAGGASAVVRNTPKG